MFSFKDIIIINDNIINLKIEKNTIDLIITSPPYNLDIQYQSNDDKLDYNEYLEFSEQWMKVCYDISKDDGRFCLNIPLDKNKNGHQSVYADLVDVAKREKWN